MRNLILIAALLFSTPALAITANNGSVNTYAMVKVNGSTISATGTDTAPGLPNTLSSSSSAVFNQLGDNVTAFSSIRAQWASASQGSAGLNWGWSAINPRNVAIESLSTVKVPNSNWLYSFSTGASAATFNGNWTLNVEGGRTFGLQGIYSFDGQSPFNITPSLFAPKSDTGSYSVALLPNTAYSFSFINFGNLGGYGGDASANFTMDWNIVESGIPEPASWAMLVTGFGLIGGAARRLRAVA